MTYSADPGDTNTSSMLGVFIKPGSKATGVQTNPEYDYSELGEIWSDPRIFRIPNFGAGDNNILEMCMWLLGVVTELSLRVRI